MYLVQVIEKVKDDFDIMTETFETEDEARKWFWYLAYTHMDDIARYYTLHDDIERPKGQNVESIMYTTSEDKEGKLFFQNLY